MSGEKLKEWLRQSLGYVSIVLLAVTYVATALFSMSETDKTLEEIVADGLVYLLLGIAMERLFSLQGMMNGERDPRVLATAKLHAETIGEIAPYMDRLDAWCVLKTKETLRTLRERLLLKCGMSYPVYFDAEGHSTGFRPSEMPEDLRPLNGERGRSRRLRTKRRRAWEAEEKVRYRCYMAALRMSVTPLHAGALTGMSGGRDDPYDFGEGKIAHEARAMRKSTLWRIVTAGLFGYFGIGLIEVFSYEELLLRLFQVALALAMGAVQQHRGYIYVTEEQRGKTIRKIDTLQMFAAAMRREEAGAPVSTEKKEEKDNEQDDGAHVVR